MTTYNVSYQTTASFTVQVDIADDGMDEGEAREAAREAAEEAFSGQAPGSLCHQCAAKYDLADFEQGEGDSAVWAS